jgi:hypothetical protein
MKRVLVVLMLAGIGLNLAPVAARAQSIEVGARGLRVDPYGAPNRRDRVNEWEARRIARAHGLARVWNVFRTRDVWVVSGEDWRRRPMRVMIDEDDGRVIDIDRDRR